jgi:hypothetical protein
MKVLSQADSSSDAQTNSQKTCNERLIRDCDRLVTNFKSPGNFFGCTNFRLVTLVRNQAAESATG